MYSLAGLSTTKLTTTQKNQTRQPVKAKKNFAKNTTQQKNYPVISAARTKQQPHLASRNNPLGHLINIIFNL